jgi:hypothetical protein
MQFRKDIFLFLYCLFVGMTSPMWMKGNGPATYDQSATFANFNLVDGDSLAGIHGIRLNFDVLMKFRGDAIIGEDESSIDYDVVATLFDETGRRIASNADAIAYSDSNGNCTDTTRIVQAKFHQNFEKVDLFVPYYAMSVLPGKRKISVQIAVFDKRDRRKVGESELLTANFEMPVLNRFRVRMNRIEVSEKDGKDDSWDYYFLNKREVLPDIRWSLLRGRKQMLMSDKQKNKVVYEGDPEKDQTQWFTLAESDRIVIRVQDFDLITFSDEIGAVEMNPWSGEFSPNREIDIAFGQVLSARFMFEQLREPKLMLSTFELLESDSEEGVTGIRLRFDYKLEYDIVGVRFRIRLAELLTEADFSPRFAWVVSGPAEHVEAADFQLTSNSGTVELFIPHYGLSPAPFREKPSLLLLSGEWRLDGQTFPMAGRQRELLQKHKPVNDFVFGQWSAGEEIREGIVGLLFSCEYRVSGHYLKDLPGAALRLYPEMKMQLGAVPPGYLQRIAPADAKWKNDVLLLSPEVDSSRLDLFMPYYMLPRELENLQLDLSYHADMTWEGKKTDLGGFELEQEISLPRRISLRIRVKEAGAKRQKRFFNQPALEWRVYQGNMEKYRSRPIAHDKTILEWRPEEAAELVLTEKDHIRVEVYRVVGNSEPTRLGLWEGELTDLPEVQKGFHKLEAEGLKKLTVKVEEVGE